MRSRTWLMTEHEKILCQVKETVMHCLAQGADVLPRGWCRVARTWCRAARTWCWAARAGCLAARAGCRAARTGCLAARTGCRAASGARRMMQGRSFSTYEGTLTPVAPPSMRDTLARWFIMMGAPLLLRAYGRRSALAVCNDFYEPPEAPAWAKGGESIKHFSQYCTTLKTLISRRKHLNKYSKESKPKMRYC